MKNFIKITLLCSLTVCNLLCNAENNPAIIDKATQYDLDLTRQQQNLPEVFKAATKAGKNFIDRFLLQPTDSIETLRNRQEITNFITDQNNLYVTLKEYLQTLASYESALVLEKEQLSQEALKKFYFSSSYEKFNRSPYALDASYAAHLTWLCLPAIEYLLLHAGFNWFAGAHDDDHDDHDHSACGHKHPNPADGKFRFYGFHGLILGMHAAPLKNMVEDVQQRAAMIKLLQQQMIHLACYVKTTENIYRLLKRYDAENLTFAPFQELGYFFAEQPRCSAETQKLLALLEESTFTGNVSVLSHVGNILAAYKLYTQVHQEFNILINALGEIDAYVSVADIMKNQTAEAPWCFVTCKKSAQPSIVAKNIRHLFIPAAQSKNWNVNSADGLHTFITGDNGTGKSTFINGIGHALILAQTFGIAPAEYFEITPFSHICTYRFIEDNITQGLSRFYAECGRIDAIMTTVNESSGLSCVLLDEPFTSTNAQKGSNFLETALSKLYEKNNVISFTASHYGALSAITQEHEKTKHLHLR